MKTFFEMLAARWEAGARVCVGLDTDENKLPASVMYKIGPVSFFNQEIVRATQGSALCYKPNMAFYSGKGADHQDLHLTMRAIQQDAPGIPVIIDAKRADIGSSSVGYVEEAFDVIGADAVTVNPYFGQDALQPFLNQTTKGIIVLCRTSNPGAAEFQNRIVMITDEEAEKWGLEKGTTMPFYQLVAYRVSREWNDKKNCALVVGATFPEELRQVRNIVGDDMWLLNPGVGKKQGGKVGPVVRNGINSRKHGILINAGSDALYASNGPDFADATGQAVASIAAEINNELALIAA